MSDGGQVYLAGLPEKGELLVKWGNEPDRQCRVRFELGSLKITPDNPIRKATYRCE